MLNEIRFNQFGGCSWYGAGMISGARQSATGNKTQGKPQLVVVEVTTKSSFVEYNAIHQHDYHIVYHVLITIWYSFFLGASDIYSAVQEIPCYSRTLRFITFHIED
jgi:hypothetical protein